MGGVIPLAASVASSWTNYRSLVEAHVLIAIKMGGEIHGQVKASHACIRLRKRC